MSVQIVINTGTFPNDGTGDNLLTAFQKINANFTQIYAALTGGAGGGITSVTAGDGLTTSPNPITSTGTISLQNRFADSMLLMGA